MSSYMNMNFHTHTVYCDGKNTPAELVEEAIAKGFTALGFSGHAYTPMDLRYCMSEKGTEEYREEIFRLKDAYKGQIDIYCGLEMDYFSETDTNGYDFLIGSVHYLYKDGEYHSIDGGVSYFEHLFSLYKGDGYALAEDYYRLLGEVVDKTKADIVGHFDLLEKFNKDSRYFSASHPRYERASLDALSVLLKTGCIFEINTGALSRGYSALYPSKALVCKMAEAGARLILSSDCHQKENLDFAFSSVKELPYFPAIEGCLLTSSPFPTKK